MFRLFLLGLLMGIADLIPGVSGGTIAYSAGIYEELLLSIQSLQLHALKKIRWRFLLPLGGGMILSFLSLAQFFHALLKHPYHSTLLFAFFFGVILASTLFCFQKAPPKRLSHGLLFALGAGIAFLISGGIPLSFSGYSIYWLFFSGMLAALAMLLPGISGSYILQLLGIYPVALMALANISTGWPFLLPLFFGVALGIVLFSKLVGWLIFSFRLATLAFLTGLMLGGLRSVWPFSHGNLFYCSLCAVLGFLAVVLLELRTSVFKHS